MASTYANQLDNIEVGLNTLKIDMHPYIQQYYEYVFRTFVKFI